MPILRSKLALGTATLGLAALAAGAWLPAIGQEKPESILPPGFSDPAPPPAAQPTPIAPVNRPVQPTGPAPQQTAPGIAAAVDPLDPGAIDPADEESAVDEEIDPEAVARYELPLFARRSTAEIGIIGPEDGGVAADAFGRRGQYVGILMQRIDAPIASRWLSIALRQALASRVATPADRNGADLAAERAWLLLRMGEIVVARAVVQAVDTANYTPKLFEAALQVALATGDPAMLCPLVTPARAVSFDRAWVLAEAMCAGLSAEPAAAGPLIDAARRRGVARGIDLSLAEKILGAGSKGRRAVTIEWDSVDELTAWRYGLASAGGVEIPERLLSTANPRVQYWRAQSPGLDPATRVGPAELAAAQGVFSNAALVDLYGAVDAEDSDGGPQVATAADLRAAYSDGERATRLSALTQLWDASDQSRVRYARLVLTARAAARLPVAANTAEADRLIAAMLSAGLDSAAQRWRNVVPRGSEGWAMLTLADREGSARVGGGAVNDYNVSPLKTQMFFAALAGLGRLSPGDTEALAESLGVPLGLQNSWTRALDRAVTERQQGVVLLLAATGMQTRDWRGVSPVALFQIVDAMRRVGLDAQARLIAIEALTRL